MKKTPHFPNPNCSVTFSDQGMLPAPLGRVLWTVDLQFPLQKAVRFRMIHCFYNISLTLTSVAPEGAHCLFQISCWAFIYRVQRADTWKRSDISFSLIFEEKSWLETTSSTATSFLQWCWTSELLLGSVLRKFEVLTAHIHRGIWASKTQ